MGDATLVPLICQMILVINTAHFCFCREQPPYSVSGPHVLQTVCYHINVPNYSIFFLSRRSFSFAEKLHLIWRTRLPHTADSTNGGNPTRQLGVCSANSASVLLTSGAKARVLARRQHARDYATNTEQSVLEGRAGRRRVLLTRRMSTCAWHFLLVFLRALHVAQTQAQAWTTAGAPPEAHAHVQTRRLNSSAVNSLLQVFSNFIWS